MAVKYKEKAGRLKVKDVVEKPVSNVCSFGSNVKKLAEENPRKIIHSVKVGLAMALVSLFYYFETLFDYDGFGLAAMWAILTVLLVFEFSVGATLGKGVKRGIATFVAGILGVVAHRLINLSSESEKLQPVVLVLSVYLIAAIATYVRSVPKLKAKYDYGILIFILTFSLISLLGYQDDEVFDKVFTRLMTVLIGGAVAVGVCVIICPVWAGEDLHNLVATNIEKLGTSLEGYGTQYFKQLDIKWDELDRTSLEGYKCAIYSETSEELVNYAKWEPQHGKFRYRHPWEEYLKIGGLVRDCAININTLNSNISSCTMTAEGRKRIQEPCKKVSLECGCALKELALSMKTMTIYETTNFHILKAKAAAENLRSIIKDGSLFEEAEMRQLLPSARVASLMLDVVSSSVEIVNSVNQLALLMKFKNIIPSGKIGEAQLAVNVE